MDPLELARLQAEREAMAERAASGVPGATTAELLPPTYADNPLDAGMAAGGVPAFAEDPLDAGAGDAPLTQPGLAEELPPAQGGPLAPAPTRQQVLGDGRSQADLMANRGARYDRHGMRIVPPEGGGGSGGGAGGNSVLRIDQSFAPDGPYNAQLAEAAQAEENAAGAHAAAQVVHEQDKEMLAQMQAQEERAVGEYLDRINTEHAEASAVKVQQLGNFLEQMSSHNIDPDRFFTNRGQSSRFAAAIAIAAGSMAQSMNPGTANVPLQIINQAIEQDIAAQVADMQNQQFVAGAQSNLLSQLRENYGDERAAIAALRAIRAKEADNLLAMSASRMASAQAVSTYEGTRAEIAKGVFQHLNETYQRRHAYTTRLDMRGNPANLLRFRENLRREMFGLPPVEQPQRQGGAGRAPTQIPEGYTQVSESNGVPEILIDNANNAPAGWEPQRLADGRWIAIPEEAARGWSAMGETAQRSLDERAGRIHNNGRVMIASGQEVGEQTGLSAFLASEEMWSKPGGHRAQLVRLRDLIEDISAVGLDSASEQQAEAETIRKNMLGVVQGATGPNNVIGEGEAERLEGYFGDVDDFLDITAVARINGLIHAVETGISGKAAGVGATWHPGGVQVEGSSALTAD